ncbi:MAG: hypothetical protein JWM65_2813 [Sphingomonas bacterium]|nr:hypothetical protein [Sphingomonas bacterium]
MTLLAPLSLLALLSSTAPAAETVPVRRAPAPAGIEWAPIPAANPARLRAVEGGTYDLLEDTQVDATGDLPTTFRRQAIKAVDRQGLESAAQNKITVDPAYQRLIIHRIAVWRDGRMIDQTARAEIDLLRRESDLDDGVITGERTALIRLADVRVGDVVDIAWSWQSVASAWRGNFFDSADLGWSVPTGLTRYRLTMPASRPLVARSVEHAPAPTIRRVGNMVVREWRVVDPDPVSDSTGSPKWWTPWARVDLSTMADWRTIDAWSQPFYAQDMSLPADYAARIDAIAAASMDPKRRTIAALHLVQDSIRYTSLSIGAGSFVPHPPAATVRNGFGDCKDKTLLLVAVLRRLGVAAWPALTDTDQGPALDRILPAANAFDHVITLATIGGRNYWLDATMDHQGGQLDTLAPLPYGFALPLRPNQDRLVAIANPVPAAPTMATIERYRLDGDGMTIDIHTFYSSDEADIERARLAKNGLAKTESGELDSYRAFYPGLQSSGSVGVADDRDANRLVVHQRFILPTTADDYARTTRSLEIQADTIRNLYTRPGGPARAAPVAMTFSINRTHRMIIDVAGFRPSLSGMESSHGPGFDFDASSHHDGDKLVVDFALVGKAPIVAGSEAPAIARQIDTLQQNTDWLVDTIERPATAEQTRGAIGFASLTAVLGFLGGWLARSRRRPRCKPGPWDVAAAR